MLRTLDNIAGRVIALSAILGTLGLIAEVVVILIDVTGRYFGAPLTGAQDITQMSMLVLVFGGMALCDRQGGHIAVDVFERAFPGWLIRLGDLAAALVGAAIFAGVAYNMWFSARMSVMLHQSTNILYLPFAWFKYYIVATSAITAFGMALRFLVLLTGGRVVRETATGDHAT